MASTISLQDSINWALPFLRFAPVTIGTNNEPAVTIGNLVKQTILSAPFCWRWNRATTTFATVAGTQDYSVALGTFGFIEKAWLTDGTTTWEIPQISGVLGGATEKNRPSTIAAQMDDNAGNITFRLLSVPDAVYTVTVLYQKKATLFTSAGLSAVWSPIPDEFSFVYNQGMLGMSLLYYDDPRWQLEIPRFLASLLGVSEGLDETQKNVFLANWLASTEQQIALQNRAQAGVSSRR